MRVVFFWGGTYLDFHTSYISSGDSTGSTVAQSQGAYDDIIARRPNNILALNHETYRKLMANAM